MKTKSKVRAMLKAAVAAVPACDCDEAGRFQRAVERMLDRLGCAVSREVAVKHRGDGRGGRIDLRLESDGEVLMVEIDHESARQKSLFKLSGTGEDWAVVLRASKEIVWRD